MSQAEPATSVYALRNPLKNEAGLTLVLVLVAMLILGLSAGIAGSTISSLTRRAREADLLWKGEQIRKAIGEYYQIKHGQGAAMIYPSKLEYLLKDPRFLEPRRYLRRLYPDPMTGKDWVLIKDQGGRIKGVHSSLEEEPFKQSNFSDENKNFEGRELYTEWEFVYVPKQVKTTTPEGQKEQPQNTQPQKTPAPSGHTPPAGEG